MVEIGATADVGAGIALVAISFFSFMMGMIFRRWPDKIQEYVEDIDGFVYFLSPRAHRTGIELAGLALVVLSVVALLAATRFL